ncbi:hypothetical protein AVEN_60136-1 [Araneus ventricosus]|uniref:Uncharacterized protein n=1 Tax=Araneus ventricosus TaxID=182803 RepID=A0A4Y2HZ30_ARAVE|nr:hypothetical protein AVEN_60136-1 [Araneus ventricosus]
MCPDTRTPGPKGLSHTSSCIKNPNVGVAWKFKESLKRVILSFHGPGELLRAGDPHSEIELLDPYSNSKKEKATETNTSLIDGGEIASAYLHSPRAKQNFTAAISANTPLKTNRKNSGVATFSKDLLLLSFSKRWRKARAILGRDHSFELWSDVEDVNSSGNPSPRFSAKGSKFDFQRRSELHQAHIHDEYLVELYSEPFDLTARPPRSEEFQTQCVIKCLSDDLVAVSTIH